ncbi:hypothetical protein PV10_02563, partial [Exophiala mesophila]
MKITKAQLSNSSSADADVGTYENPPSFHYPPAQFFVKKGLAGDLATSDSFGGVGNSRCEVDISELIPLVVHSQKTEVHRDLDTRNQLARASVSESASHTG